MLPAITVGLAIGVACARHLPGSPWPLCLLFAIAPGRLTPRVARLALALVLILPAAWWAEIRTPHPGPHDISIMAPRRWLRIVGVVATPPEPRPGGWRARVQVLAIDTRPGQPVDGTVAVTWDSPLRAGVGEVWQFAGSLKRPDGAENPGDFDHAAFLARTGVFAVMHAAEAHPETTASSPAPGWAVAAGLDRVRRRLVAGVGAGLEPDAAALLGSLVLGGGAAPVAADEAERFRSLGLSHLLAASGSQVAMLGGLAYAAGRGLGAGPLLAAAACVPLLIFYLALTGAPPAMVRATVMGLFGLLGLALGRRAVPDAAFYGTIILLLAWQPAWLWDLGFQFSCLATYGLLRLGHALESRSAPGPSWLISVLLVPVAAFAWVTPWQLQQFQITSWLALPANWLATPLILLLTPWGLAVAGVGAVAPQWAAWLNLPSGWLLSALHTLVWTLASVPDHQISVAQPGLAVLGATYGMLLAGSRRRWLAIACGIAATLAAYVGPERADRNKLQLAFLAVGQGDALVLRTPGGAWVVVDGGPAHGAFDAGTRTLLPYLRRAGCRELALVVATHAHQDHVGGLASLCRALPTRLAWDAGQGQDPAAPGYEGVLAAWLATGVPWAIAHRGLAWERDGVRLEVLSSPRPGATVNDGSVVIRLTHGHFSALLAGDLEEEGERAILAGHPLSAQVLKVGHHGSVTSTSPAWLAAIHPALAVISVGRNNRFRHPSPSVVARLQATGCKVARTDQAGAILVQSDGIHWSYATGTSRWRTWQPGQNPRPLARSE